MALPNTETRRMDSVDSIPVVIVTGHIGSGKTTLINEISTHCEGTISYLCHRFLQEFGTTPPLMVR
jgi:predicted ATPase